MTNAPLIQYGDLYDLNAYYQLPFITTNDAVNCPICETSFLNYVDGTPNLELDYIVVNNRAKPSGYWL